MMMNDAITKALLDHYSKKPRKKPRKKPLRKKSNPWGKKSNPWATLK